MFGKKKPNPKKAAVKAADKADEKAELAAADAAHDKAGAKAPAVPLIVAVTPEDKPAVEVKAEPLKFEQEKEAAPPEVASPEPSRPNLHVVEPAKPGVDVHQEVAKLRADIAKIEAQIWTLEHPYQEYPKVIKNNDGVEVTAHTADEEKAILADKK